MVTLRICLLWCAAAWLAGSAACAAGARILVDGRAVPADVPPMSVAGTLLVPLRFIGEALGAEVSWDYFLKTATVRGNGRTIVARVGDGVVRASTDAGDAPPRAYTAEAAPRVIGGRIMVPLRAVGLALGAMVDWDARASTVVITTGGPAVPPPPAAAGGEATPLRVTLRTDRREYRAGEPVQITLEARNPGSAPVTLHMTSGQKYDFEVRQGETLVWRWSDDRMFTQALVKLPIPPRDGVVFRETWNQRDRRGRLVEPGDYTITGYLADRTLNLPRPSVTIRITAGG